MRVLSPEFTDSLRGERYPFLGTGPITSGSLILPDDCLLDVNLMVDENTTEVFLSDVVVSAGTALFHFTFGSGAIVGTLNLDNADGNGVAPIFNNNTMVVGYARIDVGVAQIVKGWPSGQHLFIDVQLIPHLLIVSNRAWRRGFELPDGTVLEGDVYLVGDRGVWLERTADGFKVHVTGDPFDGRTVPARGLSSINDLVPDANGNINLIGLASNGDDSWTIDGTPFRISVIPRNAEVVLRLVSG